MAKGLTQNINGPIAALGHHLRLRAEALITQPRGAIGRTRGLHITAMIERSGSSGERDKPGFFNSELVRELAEQLLASNAHLQPEESRFRDIMSWHDPEQLRREMRSNLMRLVGVRSDPCIKIALDMHVLHDLYMRNTAGLGGKHHHLTSGDMYEHYRLRQALGRCIQSVPELVLWSELKTTVKAVAEAA